MKHRFMGLTAAATLLASLAAYAGIKADLSVSLTKNSDGTAFMAGSLGSTRNSSSPSAQMGCHVAAFAGSTTRIASCFGNDGTSVLSCSTADPAVVETISSVSGDSLVDINIDAKGTCTTVTVQNESWIAPKIP
jgi:hypothetical protein